MSPLKSADELSGAERRAGDLLSAATLVEPPGEFQLARVRRRLTGASRASSRAAWTRWAVAGVLCISAASGAYLTQSIGPDEPQELPASEPSRPATTGGGQEKAGPLKEPQREAPTADVAEPPETEAIQPQPHSPRQDGAASALERESVLMAEALGALRRQNDPSKALTLLERYFLEFPRGALSAEARVAKAEALDRLGRSEEALSVLDQLSLTSAHLLVLRGNLRAKLGKCQSAIADYDRALASPNAEALMGRAACRAQLGQNAGATADYKSYLKHFPKGRQAEQAQRGLK